MVDLLDDTVMRVIFRRFWRFLELCHFFYFLFIVFLTWSFHVDLFFQLLIRFHGIAFCAYLLAYNVHTSCFRAHFYAIFHCFAFMTFTTALFQFSHFCGIWFVSDCRFHIFVILGFFSRCMVLVYKHVFALLVVPRCSHYALSVSS